MCVNNVQYTLFNGKKNEKQEKKKKKKSVKVYSSLMDLDIRIPFSLLHIILGGGSRVVDPGFEGCGRFIFYVELLPFT